MGSTLQKEVCSWGADGKTSVSVGREVSQVQTASRSPRPILPIVLTSLFWVIVLSCALYAMRRATLPGPAAASADGTAEGAVPPRPFHERLTLDPVRIDALRKSLFAPVDVPQGAALCIRIYDVEPSTVLTNRIPRRYESLAQDLYGRLFALLAEDLDSAEGYLTEPVHEPDRDAELEWVEACLTRALGVSDSEAAVATFARLLRGAITYEISPLPRAADLVDSVRKGDWRKVWEQLKLGAGDPKGTLFAEEWVRRALGLDPGGRRDTSKRHTWVLVNSKDSAEVEAGLDLLLTPYFDDIRGRVAGRGFWQVADGQSAVDANQ